jgi:phosphoserine phosphatase RsbU/P
MGHESFVAFAKSFPVKLFLELLITVYAVSFSKADKGPRTRYFFTAVCLLFARDLLAVFFSSDIVFFASDIALLCVLLFALGVPATRGRLVTSFIAVGVAAAALATYLSFSPDPEESTVVFPRVSLLIYALFFGAIVAFVPRRAEEASDPMAGGEPGAVAVGGTAFLAVGYGAYAGLIAVFGYQSDLSQYVFMPLSYTLIFVLLLRLNAEREARIEEERAYYAGAIGSVYDFLESTSEPFKTEQSMEGLLDRANQVAVVETKADGGVLFLVDEFDDVIAARSYYGQFPPPFKLPNDLPKKAPRVETFVRNAQFKVGESIFGEVAQTGKAAFIVDAASDARVFVNGDEDFLSYKSLIVAPFVVGGRTIGILAVVKKTESFSKRDFDRCCVLADFGALVVNNLLEILERSETTDIEKEAAIAGDIQRTLLPKKLPDFDKLLFGGFTLPARGVCGDYYDIIQTRKDKFAIVMGDVAGKGITASLVMVMIRSILHLVTNTNRDSATVLNWVNKGITGKIDVDHYATLSVLSVNLENGEVEYANASHQPMLIYRREARSIETVEIKSLPIGVERKTEYQQVPLKLKNGDIIILYTDGLVEAMNDQGKQYGRKNLGNIVMKNRDLSAKDIAAKVRADLQDFVGQARQHDDQSLLVLKAKL